MGRTHKPEFRAKVALATIQGDLSLAEGVPYAESLL
jgi:hypothetical protein